jgi:hypothetical protein
VSKVAGKLCCRRPEVRILTTPEKPQVKLRDYKNRLRGKDRDPTQEILETQNLTFVV